MSQANRLEDESEQKAPPVSSKFPNGTFVCDLRDLPTEALERIRAKVLAGKSGSATD